MQILVIFIYVTLMQNISTAPSNMSYSFVAVALNSRTHYAYGTIVSVVQVLREAFEYMADTKTCVTALQEVDHYRQKQGTFSKDFAQKMAYDSNTSPGDEVQYHGYHISWTRQKGIGGPAMSRPTQPKDIGHEATTEAV
jgi:hypothetical protein